MVNIQRLHVLVVLFFYHIKYYETDNVQNKQYVIRKYNKKCGYDLRGELKKKKIGWTTKKSWFKLTCAVNLWNNMEKGFENVHKYKSVLRNYTWKKNTYKSVYGSKVLNIKLCVDIWVEHCEVIWWLYCA